MVLRSNQQDRHRRGDKAGQLVELLLVGGQHDCTLVGAARPVHHAVAMGVE